MKKLKVLVLILILIFVPSCGAQKEHKDDDNKVEVKSVDMKAASNVMSNYMTCVLLGNTAGMNSYYTANYKSKMENVAKVTEPHPVGYKIEQGEGSEGDSKEGSSDKSNSKESNAKFKVHIYNCYTGKPYFSEDVFSYTMKNDDGKILIDSVERQNSTEIYENDKKIFKRTIDKSDDKSSEEEVLSINELPEYVTPEGISIPEEKVAVPRGAFGPCALSSNGDTIALTSTGENTFLCLVKPNEDSETNAQGGDEKDSGGSDNKGGQDEGKAKEGAGKAQTKKAKVTITPVDFYFGSKVNNISFSQDGKMFVVEYAKPSGMSKIAAYEENKKEISLKLDETFKPDRFSISSPVFSEDGKIQFKVQAVSKATDEEKKMNGYWNVDTKTGKVNKVNL